MPKKMGRPRVAKKDALGTIFGVRLRPAEARRINEAIRKSGRKRADWLRDVLLTAAG